MSDADYVYRYDRVTENQKSRVSLQRVRNETRLRVPTEKRLKFRADCSGLRRVRSLRKIRPDRKSPFRSHHSREARFQALQCGRACRRDSPKDAFRRFQVLTQVRRDAGRLLHSPPAFFTQTIRHNKRDGSRPAFLLPPQSRKEPFQVPLCRRTDMPFLPLRRACILRKARRKVLLSL